MNSYLQSYLITAILSVILLFANTKLNANHLSDAAATDPEPDFITERISDDQSIQPYHNNPWYWQYEGEPVMLLGASDRDNLWQQTGEQLTDHLDRMQAAGGNYVCKTMSDRNEGDTYAAKEIEDGLYDLEQWNEEYWDKLRFFLEETYKRDIIVQLTLWDWFDLFGDNVYGRFVVHPLNPENNITWDEGTIEDAWDYYGGSLRNNGLPVVRRGNKCSKAPKPELDRTNRWLGQ